MKNLECVNKINIEFIFILLLYIMLSNNFNIYTNSTLAFVLENYKQIILFLLVFVIIFIVEYITNANAILYGATQIPGISGATPPLEHKKSRINGKRRKMKK